MKIHQLPTDEVLQSLHTSLSGLTMAEAKRRLLEFGPNQVERARERKIMVELVKEFTHFFALILWMAAGLAFWAEIHDPGQGMALLGGAVVAVIIINGLFSFWQTYRAERALAALEKLLPHRAKVLREGNFLEIPTTELVPGDLATLEAGDLVSADCRLVEAFGMRVNNATVTGESLPRIRNSEASLAEEPLQSDNVVLAGTNVVSGDGKAVVYATGMHTEFGKIAHLTQTTGETTFPLQQELRKLSRVVAVLATSLGVVFFLIGLTIPLSFWQNFMFAIGIIVANVPEGLLPTVTLSLAMGAQRMARRNVLIRHLPAVETLGSATVICTDKTGTLTQNRMVARKIYLAEGIHSVNDFTLMKSFALHHPRFFETLLLCQNLHAANHQGKEELVGDPTEIALVELGKQNIPVNMNYPRVDEVPFDSDRRRLSTLHQTPDGLILFTKGALESLWPLCTQVEASSGVEPVTNEWQKRFQEAESALAGEGLRILAIAYRDVEEGYERRKLEQELVLVGLVGLEDPPRPEVPQAVKTCHQAGIRVIMVTGDHPKTAVGVARQVGLINSNHPLVIPGEQVRRMTNSQLQLALDKPEIIFARLSADQKMRIVTILQKKGEVVAVTGDGVNDAPALKKADIGIAMGMAGTDVARESADIVLTDDNFASIVAAIEEGRAVYDNIGKFLTYILTSNIPELIPYLAFVLFRIPLPLTIIQILAVDLGTDLVPALALGSEKPDVEVMQRQPRHRKERLLTWPLFLRAYLFLGILEAIAAMAAFFFVLFSAGWHLGQSIHPEDALYPVYLQATTACLGAIVIMQVVNVFLCRSRRKSIFSLGFFSNPMIFLGIGLELLLMAWISYTDLGNRLFGTAPLSWQVWLFVIPFALGMLILEELRKRLFRPSK